MQSLTSLRAVTTAASLALAGVLGAASQANAAINTPVIDTPNVVDGGKTLNVPIGAVTGEIADPAVARNMAAALVGGWVGSLVEDAAAEAPSIASTCQVTVRATDPDGATGTAAATVPADGSISSLSVPDQARGTRWGVGDLDHIDLKLTCTDTRGNTRLSEVTYDQGAIGA